MEHRATRTGWSENDTALLMERARQAREQGRPLREVFESTAFETGRKPNSIRNFYYAQSRSEEGARRARFIPFAPAEAENLTREILTARAGGESVRACVNRLAGGDQRLMLRYQNKYRAMLKNRPEIFERITAQLREQGLSLPSSCRARADASDILGRIRENYGADRRVCDMLTTLEELLDNQREAGLRGAANYTQVISEARGTLQCVKNYIQLDPQARESGWGEFICELVKCAAALEQALAAGENQSPRCATP